MTTIVVRIGDAPEVEASLAQHIYEYNAAATGFRDGESFTAVRHSDAGKLEAGACGWTWGGCCHVSYLWVSEALRGKGIGSELLEAVERHAREKGCLLVFVSTHSFQAPDFYARKGYEQIARINDHPIGHSSLFFARRLNRQ